MTMTNKDREKVIGHALDHASYGWAGSGLPVRHDRREWTEEESSLYRETYKKAIKKQGETE